MTDLLGMLDAVKDDNKDYTPLTPGVYQAEVSKAVVIEPLEAGKHKRVQWEFTLTGEGEGAGRKVFAHDHLTDKAVWTLKRNLDALGIYGELKEQGNDALPSLVDSQVGVLVEVDVTAREWQGKVQNDAYVLRKLDLHASAVADPFS